MKWLCRCLLCVTCYRFVFFIISLLPKTAYPKRESHDGCQSASTNDAKELNHQKESRANSFSILSILWAMISALLFPHSMLCFITLCFPTLLGASVIRMHEGSRL